MHWYYLLNVSRNVDGTLKFKRRDEFDWNFNIEINKFFIIILHECNTIESPSESLRHQKFEHILNIIQELIKILKEYFYLEINF